ncbi:MAG: GGDEF domain-containing protein, partial [Chloroflexota bacterium]
MKKKSTPAPKALRRKAETKLKQLKKKTVPLPVTEADTLRLIHKLQVHQVELEMQNEELVRWRAEAEEVYRQYTDLYDFAPVGYLTLARDGKIHEINLAGANLLGMERGNLIKRSLEMFVAVESRAVFNAFFDKLLSGTGRETCELAFRQKGKGLLWVRIEATCFEGGQESRIIMVDITEHKQTVAELQYLSLHDMLTGLYNQGFFWTELKRLERGRKFPVSIVMADVDHLKRTNDHGGHAAGDALLKRVARLLTTTFRAEDVVARLSGDEFAVLLPATDIATTEVLLRRVRQAIDKKNSAHPELSINL